MKEYYSAKEVADILRLSVSTVNRFLNKGILKGFRTSNESYWRITGKDLLKYIEEHNIPREFLCKGKRKVLVIDSDQRTIHTIRKILEPMGMYHVESAVTGFTAGTKFESLKPDLVILNICLQDIDGMEFLNYIRSNSDFSNTRVVGISGTIEVNVKELLAAGFDGLLAKPVKVEALLDTVRTD